MKIAPSILSADFANLGRDVKEITAAGADYLHLDLMDGHFVPNLSFGIPVVKALRSLTDLPFDCHLMVSNPQNYIEPIAKAGAQIIGVHAEATAHLCRIFQSIKQAGCYTEVVINPATSLAMIQEILPLADAVLVMTVNPGFGGQQFLPFILKKLQRLSEIRRQRNYHFKIEVDGGINDKTIKECALAGADIAVAGSFIFKADPVKQIKLLRDAVKS
jgi:ribulose-phosphate 3-epimerase